MNDRVLNRHFENIERQLKRIADVMEKTLEFEQQKYRNSQYR